MLPALDTALKEQAKYSKTMLDVARKITAMQKTFASDVLKDPTKAARNAAEIEKLDKQYDDANTKRSALHDGFLAKHGSSYDQARGLCNDIAKTLKTALEAQKKYK